MNTIQIELPDQVHQRAVELAKAVPDVEPEDYDRLPPEASSRE